MSGFEENGKGGRATYVFSFSCGFDEEKVREMGGSVFLVLVINQILIN